MEQSYARPSLVQKGTAYSSSVNPTLSRHWKTLTLAAERISILYYDSLANPQFQLSVAVSLSFLFSLRTPLSPSPMLKIASFPPPLPALNNSLLLATGWSRIEVEEEAVPALCFVKEIYHYSLGRGNFCQFVKKELERPGIIISRETIKRKWLEKTQWEKESGPAELWTMYKEGLR